MVNVKVSYKYGGKGSTATANVVILAEAKTESAVLAALHKKYPTHSNILILKFA